MEFDFDRIYDRRGTNCVKWDSSEDSRLLPLWVADMDFKAAPAIIKALEDRVAQGIFGYTRVSQNYYDAVINWFKTRHQWTISQDSIIYTPGIVPALSAIIKALTQPGDKVLIQTPVYNCFFSSTRNNGCETKESPLVYKDNTYHIDFERLDRDAADPAVKVMVLCNPHNPAGRVWTKEELLAIAEICKKHNVTVVSDEIHCELVFEGHKYTPFASLSDEIAADCVSCTSASKAFNIAGLQMSNIVCKNPEIRAKIDKAVNINEVCDVNPFGVLATIAAYNQSADWLEAVIKYIHGNYVYMKEYCDRQLPLFPVANLEGTYLAWMDCKATGMSSARLEEVLKEKAGIWLNPGTMYGETGEGFMRWNLACPRSILTDALDRFRNFVSPI